MTPKRRLLLKIMAQVPILTLDLNEPFAQLALNFAFGWLIVQLVKEKLFLV
jgi:low temperature requirement protein LtrA